MYWHWHWHWPRLRLCICICMCSFRFYLFITRIYMYMLVNQQRGSNTCIFIRRSPSRIQDQVFNRDAQMHMSNTQLLYSSLITIPVTTHTNLHMLSHPRSQGVSGSPGESTAVTHTQRLSGLHCQTLTAGGCCATSGTLGCQLWTWWGESPSTCMVSYIRTDGRIWIVRRVDHWYLRCLCPDVCRSFVRLGRECLG